MVSKVPIFNKPMGFLFTSLQGQKVPILQGPHGAKGFFLPVYIFKGFPFNQSMGRAKMFSFMGPKGSYFIKSKGSKGHTGLRGSYFFSLLGWKDSILPVELILGSCFFSVYYIGSSVLVLVVRLLRLGSCFVRLLRLVSCCQTTTLRFLLSDYYV